MVHTAALLTHQDLQRTHRPQMSSPCLMHIFNCPLLVSRPLDTIGLKASASYSTLAAAFLRFIHYCHHCAGLLLYRHQVQNNDVNLNACFVRYVQCKLTVSRQACSSITNELVQFELLDIGRQKITSDSPRLPRTVLLHILTRRTAVLCPALSQLRKGRTWTSTVTAASFFKPMGTSTAELGSCGQWKLLSPSKICSADQKHSKHAETI